MSQEAPPSESHPGGYGLSEPTAQQPDTSAPLTKQAETRKAKKAGDTGGETKLNALDAAARVLGETARPMNRQERIAAMTEKGYWVSPGGKTPQATLYSAILRQITTKAQASRFQKVARGKFARKTTM